MRGHYNFLFVFVFVIGFREWVPIRNIIGGAAGAHIPMTFGLQLSACHDVYMYEFTRNGRYFGYHGHISLKHDGTDWTNDRRIADGTVHCAGRATCQICGFYLEPRTLPTQRMKHALLTMTTTPVPLTPPTMACA